MGPALVDLKNVRVIRGDNVALDDISVRIECGEHVCIFGPNGCGKSTLIKTITRECYPMVREGSAMRILGRERWDIFELRTHLGIVSPDLLASCTTDSTGRDVVLSGFFSSTRIFPHHHPEAEHLQRTEAVMARIGISHLADRPVVQMSSGEAKRTLIARALVHQPDTLLFDEPSNALDIGAQFQLRQTMRELARHGGQAGHGGQARPGLAIILVTHHVSEIIPEIERVILLQDGRIMADGAKQKVLSEENLRALFGIEIRLERSNGYFHVY